MHASTHEPLTLTAASLRTALDAVLPFRCTDVAPVALTMLYLGLDKAAPHALTLVGCDNWRIGVATVRFIDDTPPVDARKALQVTATRPYVLLAPLEAKHLVELLKGAPAGCTVTLGVGEQALVVTVSNGATAHLLTTTNVNYPDWAAWIKNVSYPDAKRRTVKLDAKMAGEVLRAAERLGDVPTRYHDSDKKKGNGVLLTLGPKSTDPVVVEAGRSFRAVLMPIRVPGA